jgi:hypothetical protein
VILIFPECARPLIQLKSASENTGCLFLIRVCPSRRFQSKVDWSQQDRVLKRPGAGAILNCRH